MTTSKVQDNNPHIVRNLIFLVIGSLIIGSIVFFGIEWWFMKFFQNVSDPPNWSLLGDFTSMISLAILAGGLMFAGVEYVSKENTRAREKAKLASEIDMMSYEIYQAIFDKLTAPEQEAARRWILTNIKAREKDEDVADWYKKTQAKIMKRQPGDKKGLPEGQSAVKLTLNCFDYIGYVADNYWETDYVKLDWISPPVAKVWKLLGPYVEQVRKVKGVDDYYVLAEKFGKQCIEWREENKLPDEKIVPGELV